MSILQVTGGRRLEGRWAAQGSKNEAGMVLAATLLTAEDVYLHDLPHTSDIALMVRLLRGFGVQLEELSRGSVRVRAERVDVNYMESAEFRSLFGTARMPLNLVGAVAGRLGVARVPIPGGDRIGTRRTDTLLNGLRDAGYCVTGGRCGYGHVVQRREVADYVDILLDEASVTGTACVLMACCGRVGTTELFNAACEPDIVQLCHMLVSMGARIHGIGSNRLVIEGAVRLTGCEHSIGPDVAEIGGIIALAKATQSHLEVIASTRVTLEPILRVFRKFGVAAEWEGNMLRIRPGSLPIATVGSGGLPLTVADAVWPGFPTDLMSAALSAATTCEGAVLFHERMYDRRLLFVDQLVGLGAAVTLCDPHRALVMGVGKGRRLRGGRVRAEDIRGGMALLIAALSADGRSEVSGLEHLDRGYECLVSRLTQIGAGVVRVATEG